MSIHMSIHNNDAIPICIYIYIYSCCVTRKASNNNMYVVRGSRLSNTTCPAHAFFKRGEECGELNQPQQTIKLQLTACTGT